MEKTQNNKTSAPLFRSSGKLLAFSLILLIILLIISAVPDFYRTYTAYINASKTYELIELSDKLFQAVRHYGFERGRVNVVLTYSGPVQDMESNRKFIIEQRTIADENYKQALSLLSGIDMEEFENIKNKIVSKHSYIEDLRISAEQNMDLDFTERNAELTAEWFPAMTGIIKEIENLLFQIHIYITSISPENDIGFRIKLEALSLRNTAGPEGSRMISANATGKALTARQLHSIQELRTLTDHHWNEIKRLEPYVASEELHDAVQNVENLYFSELRNLFDIVSLNMADPENVQEIPQEMLISKVEEALEGIAGILNAAKSYTTEISNNQKQEAVKNFAAFSISAFLLIMLVTILILFISRKIIKPLLVLTNTMSLIPESKTILNIKYTNRNDEIGKLANAINLFQKYKTERISQAEKLKIEKEKAEQATKDKGIFLAKMSHEIRTPITGIIGLTEMSLMLNPSGDIKRNLELCLTTTHSLLSLINDIIDFEKIATEKISIINEPYSILESLENTLNLYRQMADAKNLALILDVAENFPDWIISDRRRIEQILRNLINNAVKFTDSGTIKISAYTDRAEPNQIVISISDTGCGIQEADLKHIFEEFQQAESSYTKNHHGTGLGLSISNSLAEKLGGSISVSSELNKGSIFTLIIPVKIPDMKEERNI